jgi:hypothetical protein
MENPMPRVLFGIALICLFLALLGKCSILLP